MNRKSTFARRSIVCALTRSRKISLSGRRYRVTSGQFSGSSPERRTVEELESREEVLRILCVRFGIRLQPGEVLRMGAFNEKAADSKLWDHL